MENQQQNQEKKDKKSILLLVLLLLLVTITIGYAVLSTSFNIKGESKILGKWCVGLKCGTDDESCDDISSCTNSPIVCPTSEKCIITDCDKHSNQCNCDATTGECLGPDVIDCTTEPDKSDSIKCNCTASTCVPNPQIWTKGNTVYFRHALEKPKDVFTFDVTYKNGGTIDAKLGSFDKSVLNATAQQFMTYEVKYSDGSAIVNDEALNAGSSKTFRVIVTYKDVQTLPTNAQLDLINEVADGHNGATSTFTVNYVQK